jgi:predicted RNA methylase
MRSAASRLREALRRYGLFGTLRLVGHTFTSMIEERSPARRREWQRQLEFDTKYGIDTAIKVAATELRVPDPGSKAALHAVGYQPTGVSALHQILQAIPLDFANWTFVDIGAGKGRALLVGSHYPFRRIIGVELSPHLVAIARRNVATYRDPAQRCRAIECVCGDASRYRLPDEGNVLLYLYNPFGEPIMRTFLETIGEAVASARKRQIWIAYANPTLKEMFESTAFLASVPNPIGLALYRVVADGATQ